MEYRNTSDESIQLTSARSVLSEMTGGGEILSAAISCVRFYIPFSVCDMNECAFLRSLILSEMIRSRRAVQCSKCAGFVHALVSCTMRCDASLTGLSSEK